MHVHAAVEAGRWDCDISKGLALANQLAEAGWRDLEFTFCHHFQAVFGGGITEVVGQQRVHHDPLEGESMAQKDEPVVFGVLQCFGVVVTRQPRGYRFEHSL